MKQLFLFLLFLIPLTLSAQTDANYLAGAVPMKEGKIVFTHELSVPNRSQDQIYASLLQWAQQRFNTKEQRVVYKDAAKGQIAILSKEYIIFSETALSLDRSLTSYRLILLAHEGGCTVEIDGFRYNYNVSYQEKPETYLAEDWIIDEVALNGKKTKLSRVSGKFRKGTIDLVDKRVAEVSQALGASLVAEPTIAKQEITAQEPQAAAMPQEKEQPLQGFSSFTPDQLPTTLADMLPKSQLTIKSGTERSDKPVAWRGLGKLFGKSIASHLIAPEDAIYKAIGKDGMYTLLFTQAGQQEPWCMIECKKQGETAEAEGIVLMGEVINIWIR